MKLVIKLTITAMILGLGMIWAYDFALNQACSGCDWELTYEEPMTDYERQQRIDSAYKLLSKKITFSSN